MGLNTSLCLHRVADKPRPSDWQQGLSMPASELDSLIELLLSSRPGPSKGWLSVTFDDGYRDAGEYILSRSRRFPDVEFIFFICPEKTEGRAGFRWDLVEEGLKKGVSREEALEFLSAPTEVAYENHRPELQALAAHDDYQLSTVEELKELQAISNVALGNHTNLHLSSTNTPDEVVRADFERSTALFEKLFGRTQHFAFPFGTPRFHFADRHVGWLRALGDFPIWTTEPRPFRPEERKPSALLPRYPLDGSQEAATLAGNIAARALLFRVRGMKFPLPEGRGSGRGG